jgi:hypothetical protein
MEATMNMSSERVMGAVSEVLSGAPVIEIIKAYDLDGTECERMLDVLEAEGMTFYPE